MGTNNKVTVIPAYIRENAHLTGSARLRVAAYCRVSTDSDEQATSYEAQISHYRTQIEAHPGWVLVEVFADEGITGTSTRNRSDFLRMIAACERGEIDMVITKSITRFARNTGDCLNNIRRMREIGVAIYFEKDNINTLDYAGEILITIMASLAQQESESLSLNVRLGLKYRYQQGVVRTTRILGYDKDADKNLIINPEEAVIIRRIYQEYLAGASYRTIAHNLTVDGYITLTGRTVWHPDTIRRILANEKYMGDALLQKSYSHDCFDNKRHLNRGQMPQYYVTDNHPAIISREDWHAVQEERKRRQH